MISYEDTSSDVTDDEEEEESPSTMNKNKLYELIVWFAHHTDEDYSMEIIGHYNATRDLMFKTRLLKGDHECDCTQMENVVSNDSISIDTLMSDRDEVVNKITKLLGNLIETYKYVSMTSDHGNYFGIVIEKSDTQDQSTEEESTENGTQTVLNNFYGQIGFMVLFINVALLPSVLLFKYL